MADIDRVAELQPDKLSLLGKVSRECVPYWTAADHAGKIALWDDFAAEHQQYLAAQNTKYERAPQALAADSSFETFLVGRLKRKGSEWHMAG